MLIVTADPEDAETIREDLFGTGLPRDVLYNLLPGRVGQGITFPVGSTMRTRLLSQRESGGAGPLLE